MPLREPPAGGEGTTHIVLESLDLMARLAALVPPPRMHLTRYHGVFAPHSKLRPAITPAGRGKGGENTKEGAQPRASGARMRRGRAGELAPIAARAPPRQGGLL